MTSLPRANLLTKPSVIKMAKSSPSPKINVDIIMFTKLNLIPISAAIPRIHIQLKIMGRKVIKANSIRP